jgi:hypothetical protein
MTKRTKAKRRRTDWGLIGICAVGVLVLAAVVYSSLSAPQDTTVRRVEVAEAKRLVDRGEAVLVDTRDELAYRQAHAQDALWLYVDDIAARASELPEDKLLILY